MYFDSINKIEDAANEFAKIMHPLYVANEWKLGSTVPDMETVKQMALRNFDEVRRLVMHDPNKDHACSSGRVTVTYYSRANDYRICLDTIGIHGGE